jgi:hypothetical protein
VRRTQRHWSESVASEEAKLQSQRGNQ